MKSERRRAWAAVCGASVLIGFAAPRAQALEPVVIKPRHPTRGLITGSLIFFDSWKPLTPQLSGFFQVSVLPTVVTTDPSGVQTIEAPHLFLHVGVGAGYRFLQSGDQLYGLGQLGLLWRRDAGALGWLTQGGLVAALAWPQRRVGPLVRLEVLDNFGVFGGPLFGFDGRSHGAFAGVDYMYNLFNDIGVSH